MTDRRIKELTEKELVDLIQGATTGNHIAVSGVEVHSANEKLKSVEKVVNRLVEKHKDFLLLRKEIKFKTQYQD